MIPELRRHIAKTVQYNWKHFCCNLRDLNPWFYQHTVSYKLCITITAGEIIIDTTTKI